jgi:hypothetical protein
MGNADVTTTNARRALTTVNAAELRRARIFIPLLGSVLVAQGIRGLRCGPFDAFEMLD